MLLKSLFIILMASGASGGAEALPLAEVLARVEKANPGLMAARAEAERMSGMALAGYAWDSPQIAVEYMQAPDFNFSNWGARRLELSQSLPFPGGTFLKGRAAGLEAGRARAMARAELEDRLFEASRAFYMLLGSAHALQSLEKANAALAEFSRVSGSRGGYGRLDRMGQFMDRMIKTQAAQMEAMLAHWKNERRMAEAMLARLMGADPLQPLPDPMLEPYFISKMPAYTDEEVWQAAARSNAGLEEAEQGLAQARAASLATRWGWLPELMVEGAVEEDPSGMRFGSARLGASIPYAWFWKQGGETRAANARVRQAEARLAEANLMLKEEARRQNGELQSLLAQVRLYEAKVLPETAAALEQAVSGFKAGVLGAQEALMAVMAYWENNERYAGLVSGLGTAKAALDRLCAVHSRGASHD